LLAPKLVKDWLELCLKDLAIRGIPVQTKNLHSYFGDHKEFNVLGYKKFSAVERILPATVGRGLTP
jgi:hypothetical protein